MSSTIFAIHILLTMTAICASYAVLMSALKKKINNTWLWMEVLLALVAASASISLAYTTVLATESMLFGASVVALLLGIGNLLAVLIVLRVRGHDVETYSPQTIQIVRILGSIAFAATLTHFFLEIAYIGGM